MERATRRGEEITPRGIEQIPEFRQYLAREGITFGQWEARQQIRTTKGRDTTTAALELARQKLKLNRHAR